MVSEDLAEAIALWESSINEYSDAIERFSDTIEKSFGFGNLNESNETNCSREGLLFRDEVIWCDNENYIPRLFERKDKYELHRNPKQQNLLNLIDTLITDGYELTISDPHFVLSLPTEQQSYRNLLFFSCYQELCIYAKKAEEEVSIKKKVSFCEPILFWYEGIHYLVEIRKNEKARAFDNKAVLNIMKHGEPNPGLVQRLKREKDSDREIFKKMFS